MDSQAETVRVVLQLNRATDRIGGSLDDGCGRPRAFDGWLELGTLLETVRERDSSTPPEKRPNGAQR